MAVSIVVGTNNRHKLREIRQMLADVPGIELVGLTTFTGVPEIVEDADTFAGNAQKKAYELARFLALVGHVGYASGGNGSDDDEDDTDFEDLSAERHRASSGRVKKVSLTPERMPKVEKPINLELLVMADDSGLEVDALGGAPGVRSARYAGRQAWRRCGQQRAAAEEPQGRAGGKAQGALCVRDRTGQPGRNIV
jgi:hypothetical protein